MSIQELEAERAALLQRLHRSAATQERTLKQRLLPALEADLTMLRTLSVRLASET